MIFGVGTDIVELERIESMLRRHGERVALRLLSGAELPEYRGSSQPARLLAKRFAAKEAFSKAMGTGLRHPVTLGNITVGHDALGRPRLEFGAELSAYLARHGITRHHLSISDERRHAVAFVVLERD